MIIFFLELWLLVRSIARGIRPDLLFRGLTFLFSLFLLGGTLFFWRVEQWSLVDSVHFCGMTVSTVGYGDMVPTTDASKLFTVGYTVLGVALFASFVGRILFFAFEGRMDGRSSGRSGYDRRVHGQLEAERRGTES